MKAGMLEKVIILFVVFLLTMAATSFAFVADGTSIEVAILSPAAENAALEGRSIFNAPPEYFLEGKGVVKYTPVILVIYKFPFNVTEVYAVSVISVNSRKKYTCACVWHGHYERKLRFYKKVSWRQGEFFVARAKDIFKNGKKIYFSLYLYHKKVVVYFETKYYWFRPCWYARVKVFNTKKLGRFHKDALYIFNIHPSSH